MKKTILLGVFAIFGAMNAQQNSIKVNPVALVFGSDLISYERAINDNMSVVVSGTYNSLSFGDLKYKNMGGGAQYRYYFGDEVLKKFYAAVTGEFISGTITNSSEGFTINPSGTITSTSSESSVNYTNMNAGLRVGYQYIFDNGITLDANLGAGYNTYNYKFKDASEAQTFNAAKVNGILPTGGFGIGYSF